MSSRDWLGSLGAKTARDKKPAEYTDASLKGIRVEHSIDEFEAGTSQILVAEDVDVLAEESAEGDIRLVMATARQGGPRPRVALSYEDEGEEAEQRHFVIGEEPTTACTREGGQQREAPEEAAPAPKRKRSSRKKDASEMIFTEAPVFQPRALPASPSVAEEDGADLDASIRETRQRNMEMLRRRMALEEEPEHGDGDTEMAGGSFELSTVSDFLAQVRKPERQPRAEPVLPAAEQRMAIDVEQVQDRVDSTPDMPDEPLVSSSLGVGPALAFLAHRGRGLTLRLASAKGPREVQLTWYDDEGNELEAKEAFKNMSHKFHGKAPGKNKEERRLKKLAEAKAARRAPLTGARERRADAGRPPAPVAPAPKARPADAKQAAPAKKKPRIFGMA